MHRVWEIPELDRIIAQNLDHKAQARATQVCRLLWDATVPFVWCSIDLSVLSVLYMLNKEEVIFKVRAF